MKNTRYVLQSKIMWEDGNSWWITDCFRDSSKKNLKELIEISFPAVKSHYNEKIGENGIIGFEYRIVEEKVIMNLS